MSLRRLALALALPLALLFAPAGPAFAAKDPIYTGRFNDVAISGYDPVAYFSAGKPVEGKSAYEYKWNGATWRFSSQMNLDAFKAKPEAYAPQYGGYCAWAVSQGYTASTVPDAWKIVDGKLYLNYSKGVQERWQKDIPGNIAKGDANWPKVLE